MAEKGILTQDGVALKTLGSALVVLWQAPASIERWAWVVTHVEKLAGKYPEGISLLQLVLPSSNPPDSATRSRIQADCKRIGPRLDKLITVTVGDALWMSIVRTIVRGMLLLSGLSRSVVFAKNVAEAVKCIQDAHLPDTPSTADLKAGIQELFAALGEKMAAAS
jgi:hypothetical protein